MIERTILRPFERAGFSLPDADGNDLLTGWGRANDVDLAESEPSREIIQFDEESEAAVLAALAAMPEVELLPESVVGEP